jgi:hypothetical protein
LEGAWRELGGGAYKEFIWGVHMEFRWGVRKEFTWGVQMEFTWEGEGAGAGSSHGVHMEFRWGVHMVRGVGALRLGALRAFYSPLHSPLLIVMTMATSRDFGLPEHRENWRSYGARGVASHM